LPSFCLSPGGLEGFPVSKVFFIHHPVDSAGHVCQNTRLANPDPDVGESSGSCLSTLQHLLKNQCFLKFLNKPFRSNFQLLIEPFTKNQKWLYVKNKLSGQTYCGSATCNKQKPGLFFSSGFWNRKCR
jgi:hypothetical protein